MPEQTDEKLHERLTEIGQQDKDDPNKYFIPRENGGYDRVYTDDKYYQEHYEASPNKY